ncbi:MULTISPECIES: DUF742 domain-containing protein [Pseudonocardia]|uniref:DUF742 domain-containing protein n=2 Tax=Pseudonocardia TaxID=1847 RepID=A0A1Y2N9Z3_PSEAH|nr:MULTISPECIES: DUF742 domain-containing protein [Pseudonocardia]OSY43989.1 hypothetical protein BG845_00109 [Pseudonocardia autotrophica]TDN74278.1 uncharacterized protein DUF742 [Pseudonocardia autotrophica]BBG05042.1 hypothetical protein Pdca_62510 [Pseudonocardia autotrophica]GEC27969.1 hypothetical protein PSA01_49980 [Pseudonocardia saturnea]
MTQDPGGQGPEPTFADVMNGFSLDSKRKPRKRRWGWGRADDEAPEEGSAQEPPPSPAEMTGPIGEPIRGSAAYGLPPTPGERDASRGDPATSYPGPGPAAATPPPPAAGGASFVRPYAWTRGRTKSGYELAVETLVSVSSRARSQLERLPMEHRTVADLLAEQTRSVAEVAALLSLPLGVARVLLGDMASSGTVTVHQTASTPGNVPDLALMERVLSGLRRL